MKKIPAFKTELEEREFWETHDSADYLNWDSSKSVSFPNIKHDVGKELQKTLRKKEIKRHA